MNTTDVARARRFRREDAPTLLENFLWGWLRGEVSADVYFDELVITTLSGDEDVPDDSQGEEE